MSAVMENLYYFRVDHDISEYFASQPEGLEISFFIEIPYIYQECIFAIIELYHFDESSLSKVSFQVHP